MTISLKASDDGLNGTLQVGGVDAFRFGSDTSGQLAGFRNVLINADFRINQRAYASAAVLAAAVYGHDRWKAGASGGDYSFTQLKSSTQITIAAGKSVIQVVEDKNVAGGSYVLSWSGTAQARVGVNSATPSGSYAVSPILITGQTAGTVLSVEFNTGTLSNAQLEIGSIATAFEQRPIGLELSLCQRYYWKQVQSYHVTGNAGAPGQPTSSLFIKFPTTMRSAPTVSATETGGINVGVPVKTITMDSLSWSGASTAAGYVYFSGNFVDASAEL